MFEKILLNKIGLEKFRFYKKLPRKIQYKIQDAFEYAQRTKEHKDITVNGHGEKWRKKEFERLLNVFIS